MPSTQDVRVKGSPVRSLRKFLDIELSESQRERVFANVPDEYRKKITSGNILATDVFPVAVLNEIVISAANLKNEAVPSFARRAGRHAAEQAAGTVLKFFMLLMTVPALLGKATRIFSSIYDRGRFSVAHQADHAATLHLEDFPSTPVGCARISGWIERIAEMTGAKDVRVDHTKCVAKTDSLCEWKAVWR
jgi:hypothetical protein